MENVLHMVIGLILMSMIAEILAVCVFAENRLMVKLIWIILTQKEKLTVSFCPESNRSLVSEVVIGHKGVHARRAMKHDMMPSNFIRISSFPMASLHDQDGGDIVPKMPAIFFILYSMNKIVHRFFDKHEKLYLDLSRL